MSVTELDKKAEKYFRFQKAEYIYIIKMMSIETNAGYGR